MTCTFFTDDNGGPDGVTESLNNLDLTDYPDVEIQLSNTINSTGTTPCIVFSPATLFTGPSRRSYMNDPEAGFAHMHDAYVSLRFPQWNADNDQQDGLTLVRAEGAYTQEGARLVVGAYDDETFYVPFTAGTFKSHLESDNVALSLSAYMGEWLRSLGETDPEARRQRVLPALEAVLSSRPSMLESAEQSVQMAETDLQVYQRQAIDAMQTVERRRAELVVLLNNMNDIVADAETEHDTIMRHPLVKSLAANADSKTITVLTHTLEMENPEQAGDVRPLGDYKLTFKFDRPSLTIRNLTNAQGFYDHPHVNNGGFCAGEWQPTVDRLLQQHRLAEAVCFVLECLQNVNPGDAWGRHYRHWFRDE